MIWILSLAVGLVGFALGVAWSAHHRFLGVRVVTCPEDCEPAAVQADAVYAALTAPFGGPRLRLKTCTRWPDQRSCSRECLHQIQATPDACRVPTIVASWYRGRSCGLCGWRFEEPTPMDYEPALLGPEGIVDGDQVPPEKLAQALATHQPVCWHCRVLETFRRERPELMKNGSSTRSPGH